MEKTLDIKAIVARMLGVETIEQSMERIIQKIKREKDSRLKIYR